MKTFPRSGLYLVTPEGVRGQALLALVARALEGGGDIVQYRAKHGSREERLESALALNALCRERDVLFIVNDDVELAAASGADGVHVGREDSPLAAARATLGDEAIVGVSCYGDPALALQAEEQGASYVAFGSCFPSRSKPGAPALDLGLVGASLGRLRIPAVGIGGIDLHNAPVVLEHGITVLAVISAVFDAPDPARAARALAELIARWRTAPGR